jgi:esterase/lipase superfamily enzyme
MLTRILLVLVLGAGAGIANAQTAAKPQAVTSPQTVVANPSLPAPCRARSPDDLPALEKRKARLELSLAARAAKQAPARGPGADELAPKSLSKTKAALLEVTFQIHCLKLRQAAAAGPVSETLEAKPRASKFRATKTRAVAPAPPVAADEAAPGGSGTAGQLSASPGRVVEVTTYYATNRGRSGKSEPAQFYDSGVGNLGFGRALVTIPSTHAPGSLELPSIWKLQLRPDPTRHFILKSVVPFKPDYARAQMAKALQDSQSKSILVFVHGYNMSFDETAMRTAQLAYDLDFPGLPFFFSWPSAGQVSGYLRDAESAQISEAAFDQVLSDLSQLPVGEIYIIAHSMGSRIVSQVLRSRVERGKATARVSELLLAAPDINADLFRSVIAPKLAEMKGTQTTVYASSSDLALIASKTVHGYRRVGETAGGVFVYPGLDTVDASSASPVMRAFGHSYLTDSAAVLKDIRALLRQKLSAKARGLTQAGVSPDLYWSLQ